MDDAEIALIGIGFYRLTRKKRRKIRKNAEIFLIDQKRNQQPCEKNVQNPGVAREK
jgi:Holliday junction resolvase-like predicted endonuclease